MNFIILVIILYYIFCHSLHTFSSLSQIKHLLTLLFVFSSPFACSVNSIISSPLTSKVLLQGQISLPKLSLKIASLDSHHLPSALPPLVTQPAQIQNSKSFRKIFFLNILIQMIWVLSPWRQISYILVMLFHTHGA